MPILGVIASSAKGAPGIPTIGTATNIGTGRAFNNGAATVTFTAAPGVPATSFTVTSSPGGFTATGASSPLTVTGLQSSTSYTFTVTASNASGTSLPSSASNSITATTVPQAPTIGTATATGSSTATVAYTAGATGGSAITTFTATSSPTGLTATGASPITFSGLTPSTSYTFTVTATNANGTSLASAASNSITTDSVFYYGVNQGQSWFYRTPNPVTTNFSNYDPFLSFGNFYIAFGQGSFFNASSSVGRTRYMAKNNFTTMTENNTAVSIFTSFGADANRIAWNGTRWVIAGDNGAFASATSVSATYGNGGQIESGKNTRGLIATATGRFIYTNNAGNIYISDNNGVSWTLQRNVGSASVSIPGIRSSGSVVIASYDRHTFPTSGIERSTDNGTNWTRIGVGSGDSTNNFRGNTLATNDAGTWVTSRSQNFVYSTDNGLSWTDGGAILPGFISATDINWHPGAGVFILTGSNGTSNFTSPTGTGSWTQRSTITMADNRDSYGSAVG